MKIISHSDYIIETHCEIFFQLKDSSKGHGWGFRCDKNGVIDMADLESRFAALENYTKCLNGTHDVMPGEFRSWQHGYRQAAIGECSCGCEVVLDGFTNTCEKCERDYNSAGQELAHRSQWGEETGESYCDLQDL